MADLLKAGWPVAELSAMEKANGCTFLSAKQGADLYEMAYSTFVKRLKDFVQYGDYPLRAPLGYLDRGGGQVKVLDPASAPLVREAFELYATGSISLPSLLMEMERRGLRNRKGGLVSLNGMSRMLNNPFYMGVVRIRKTGEYFAGAHEPIVDRRTFDTVQAVLEGKTVPRTHRHEFSFSRMIQCGLCGRTTMVERQKRHAYYRCHTRDCATKTVREERIEEALAEAFSRIRLSEEELEYARLPAANDSRKEGNTHEVHPG